MAILGVLVLALLVVSSAWGALATKQCRLDEFQLHLRMVEACVIRRSRESDCASAASHAEAYDRLAAGTALLVQGDNAFLLGSSASLPWAFRLGVKVKACGGGGAELFSTDQKDVFVDISGTCRFGRSGALAFDAVKGMHSYLTVIVEIGEEKRRRLVEYSRCFEKEPGLSDLENRIEKLAEDLNHAEIGDTAGAFREIYHAFILGKYNPGRCSRILPVVVVFIGAVCVVWVVGSLLQGLAFLRALRRHRASSSCSLAALGFLAPGIASAALVGDTLRLVRRLEMGSLQSLIRPAAAVRYSPVRDSFKDSMDMAYE